MKIAFEKVFDSVKAISLFKYEPEENPGSDYTKLIPKYKFGFDSKERIAEIKKLLEIQDTSNDSLRTTGRYFFEFELGNGQKIQVEYLKSGRLRSETLWESDAILTRPLEFLKWLAERGEKKPLEEELKLREKHQQERERNHLIGSKIPAQLIDGHGKLEMSKFRKDSVELYEEIRSKSAHENVLLLNLFELMVLRSNNWWEVSTLEMLITKVLLGAPIEAIENAIGSENITLLQADGIGRFLTCREFQNGRKAKISKLNRSNLEKIFLVIGQLGNDKKVKAYREKVLQVK